MKKLLAVMLTFMLCLSLSACGNKTLTLEDLSDIYFQDDEARASFTFENGTMTIEVIYYVESSASPSGKVAVKTDSFAMPYTLNSENYVTVEGKKYYYEIDEEDGIVNFSVKFMELAETFYFSYVK